MDEHVRFTSEKVRFLLVHELFVWQSYQMCTFLIEFENVLKLVTTF